MSGTNSSETINMVFSQRSCSHSRLLSSYGRTNYILFISEPPLGKTLPEIALIDYSQRALLQVKYMDDGHRIIVINGVNFLPTDDLPHGVHGPVVLLEEIRSDWQSFTGTVSDRIKAIRSRYHLGNAWGIVTATPSGYLCFDNVFPDHSSPIKPSKPVRGAGKKSGPGMPWEFGFPYDPDDADDSDAPASEQRGEGQGDSAEPDDTEDLPC